MAKSAAAVFATSPPDQKTLVPPCGAARATATAGQISRYENGRITPSLDGLARIAEALNVSLDHLVFDDIARRPLHSPENILGDRLNAIAELTDDDRSSLLNVIDALVTKSRVKTLASGVS